MEETKGSILNGMHFLCAEDNDLNAEILRSMLDLKGASCVICSNGKQVVEAFEESEPDQYDAVLMDVQMPVMNGYEASRRIRTSRRPETFWKNDSDHSDDCKCILGRCESKPESRNGCTCFEADRPGASGKRTLASEKIK